MDKPDEHNRKHRGESDKDSNDAKQKKIQAEHNAEAKIELQEREAKKRALEEHLKRLHEQELKNHAKADTSADKAKSFTGELTNQRDGKTHYKVDNGDIHDVHGKLVGHLNPDGSVLSADRKASPTLVNSQFDGFTFRGTEHGQAREFVCSDNAPMSRGRITIPMKGKQHDCEVRMGMVIDKTSGQQLGILEPPKVVGQNMSGGSITLIGRNPPEKIDLAKFRDSVFELDVLDHKGAFATTKISGACLGGESRDLNGKLISGGLVNIQASIDAAQQSLAQAQQRENDNTGAHFSINYLSGAQNDLADAARTDEKTAQMTADMFQKFLQTGKVNDAELRQVNVLTSNIQVENLGGEDSVAGQHFLLDHAKSQMEHLPDDTKTIQGQVVIVDAKARDGHRTLQIHNGVVFGDDGKHPIASINSADGVMTFIDPHSGRKIAGQMSSLTGAVWHLKWSENKTEKETAFVSLGDRDGLVSINDLRRQADAEATSAHKVLGFSDSDAAKNLVDDTENAKAQFNKRLDRILAKGTEGADVGFLRHGSANVRMDMGDDSDNEAPPAKAEHTKIALPPLKTEEDLANVNGRVRIDNHVYNIVKGNLYETDASGANHGEPAGKLGVNYQVAFAGGENISLADHHRVLMEITVGGSAEKHQLIGLGPAHNTDSFGTTSGGLVDVKELAAQVEDAKLTAKAGRDDYLRTRPWCTGGFADHAMGDRQQMLDKFGATMDSDGQKLSALTAELFSRGFSPGGYSNNKLDGATNITQLIVSNVGAEGNDSVSLAQEGKQIQKMTNDSFVIAAETVATMGIAEGFTIAANAGKVTKFVQIVGTVSTGTLASGAISTIGRASDSSSAKDNFEAGAIEGFTMSAGGAASKAFGNIGQIPKIQKLVTLLRAGSLTAEELTPLDQELLQTGIGKLIQSGRSARYCKTMAAAYGVEESYFQATGFSVAGNVREHRDLYDPRAAATGTAAMFVSRGVGELAGKATDGLFEDGLATRMVSDSAMAYSNGFVGGSADAFEHERQKLADEKGVPLSTITDEYLMAHADFSHILGDMDDSGRMAAGFSPLMSLGVHSVTNAFARPAEKLGTSRDGSLFDDTARNGTTHDGTARDGTDQSPRGVQDVAPVSAPEIVPTTDQRNISADQVAPVRKDDVVATLKHEMAQHQDDANLAHGYQAALHSIEQEPSQLLTHEDRARIAAKLRASAIDFDSRGHHETAASFQEAAHLIAGDPRISSEHQQHANEQPASEKDQQPDTQKKGLTPDDIKRLETDATAALRQAARNRNEQFQKRLEGTDGNPPLRMKTPGGPLNSMPVALSDALEHLDPAVAINFNGHGIAKGNDLASLNEFLTNGPTKGRRFDEMPLGGKGVSEAAGAFGASQPFEHGAFILLSEPGQTLNRGGIHYVLVNENYYGAVPELQKVFPDVSFIRADKMADELPKILQKSASGKSESKLEGKSNSTSDGNLEKKSGTRADSESEFKSESKKESKPDVVVLPKRSADVDIDGRLKADGNRERISKEFQPLSNEEFNLSRTKAIDDLKNQKFAGAKDNASVYDTLTKDATLSDQQKARILDMLAETREHFMSINVDGKVLPDQQVNWIHTQGEISQVLESARANKLSANETEDAIIASMFSDSAKYSVSEITQSNFHTHHLDGALAADEVLTRRGFPPERIDGIVQAIREHQISPPEFMGQLYRMKIEGVLNAQIADATKISDAQKLQHLNHLKDVLNSEGPEGMAFKTGSGNNAIRQLADINNAPKIKNVDGEWELAITPDQRELLMLSGNDGHWYVPHDPSKEPDFEALPKQQQDKLMSRYRVTSALVDGDSVDNYATVNGISKIVKIRGPETFFPDKTVWDSVRSSQASYDDAYNILTPAGKEIAARRSGEMSQELYGNDGAFHDYRNTPPSNSDTSTEANTYRWLIEQGKNPTDGVPFYNEALKYPKKMSPDERTEVGNLRNRLKDETLANAERQRLESQLAKFSGLSSKEWNDYDFAAQIRDHVVDSLRGKARLDGNPPSELKSVRDDAAPVSNFSDALYPNYYAFSAGPQKIDFLDSNEPITDLGAGHTSQPFTTADGREGFITRSAIDQTITVIDLNPPRQTKYGQNRLLSVSSGNVTREFQYDQSGKLDKINLSSSEELYRDPNSDDWKMRTTDNTGRVIEKDWWHGPIIADGDGAIRYLNSSLTHAEEWLMDGTRIVNDSISRRFDRTDGSSTLYRGTLREESTNDGELTQFRSNGRTQFERANYNKESLALRINIREQFSADPLRQQRFDYLLTSFEQNATNRGMSGNDKALLYQQLNRLISTTADAPVGLAERRNLAEQILNHAARPETVDQGQNSTCNVTTVEHRLYFRHPDKAAQVIADLALTGKYATGSGDIIDLSQRLTPDAEARRSLTRQENGNNDVKIDGGRDWSTQLMNETMVNARYAGKTATDLFVADGDRILPMSPVAYDDSRKVIGMVDYTAVQPLLDAKGFCVSSFEPGDKLYNSQGAEVKNVDPDKFVWDERHYLRGQIDPQQITKLYDSFHNPLETFNAGQDAYGSDGKLILSRVNKGEITYTKGGTVPGDPFSGERLIYGHNGKNTELKDYRGRLLDQPGIYAHELEDIYTDILGRRESGFVLLRADPKRTAVSRGEITSLDDLGNALDRLQLRDSLPAIILVHTSGPHMIYDPRHIFGIGGGWHVVNVDAYDPVTKTVRFTNQWGSSHDFLDRPIPLKDLYKAMQPSAPKVREVLEMLGVHE